MGRLLTLALVVTIVALPLYLRNYLKQISSISSMESYFGNMYFNPIALA